MNQEEFTEKRLHDLANQAQNKNYPVFSDFLGLGELGTLHRIEGKIPSRFRLFGGYPDSERQMAVFLPDAFSMPENELFSCSFYPIRILRFRPDHRRFAEKLSHRDALGACMGLGFGREKLGDLILTDEELFLFAHKSISDYILDQLHQIRRTNVSGEYTEELNVPLKKREPVFLTAASNRLDAMLASLLGISRNNAQELIKSGTIYLNGYEIQNFTNSLKNGDILSARGFGKYKYCGEEGETKKGRIKVKFEKYI